MEKDAQVYGVKHVTEPSIDTVRKDEFVYRRKSQFQQPPTVVAVVALSFMLGCMPLFRAMSVAAERDVYVYVVPFLPTIGFLYGFLLSCLLLVAVAICMDCMLGCFGCGREHRLWDWFVVDEIGPSTAMKWFSLERLYFGLMCMYKLSTIGLFAAIIADPGNDSIKASTIFVNTLNTVGSLMAMVYIKMKLCSRHSLFGFVVFFIKY